MAVSLIVGDAELFDYCFGYIPRKFLENSNFSFLIKNAIKYAYLNIFVQFDW